MKENLPVVVEVHYTKRSTMPAKLEAKAQELGLTVSQLCRRFISTGMAQYEPDGDCVPGKSLEDFLVINGLLKPRSPEEKTADDELLGL